MRADFVTEVASLRGVSRRTIHRVSQKMRPHTQADSNQRRWGGPFSGS